ncbi:MAG: hypothetical protein IAE80_07975 [Anaerolinea sp.]|nr:hypothetical protein [Anaerolinea sp.]
MPVAVNWMLDKRVMYFRSYGKVSLAEVDTVVAAQMQLYEEGIAPVHAIIDIRPTTLNIQGLQQLREHGNAPLHPSTGWIVMLQTNNKLATFAVSLIIQLNGAPHFRTVHTLDEAVAFLNHNDQTLKLDPADAAAYVNSLPG